MKIIQFVTDSLGDASYLVVSGSTAAVVDPQRDVRPYLQAAAENNATIRFVFETHVHNDYVSGGRELAARGAQVVAPASANLEFPHIPVNDGDEVAVGGARVRAVAAPGHTYEHHAYLALDESGAVQGAFTGGALLMAAAGRSDLLGPEHTEELTRLQWDTAQKLQALLTPFAEVLPTHGAGSFCSTTGCGDERRASLEVESQRNPALTSPSFEVFRSIHLAYQPPIPGYYRHMAPINRSGPRVYGEPPSPALLEPSKLLDLRRGGVPVVDVRPRSDFAAAHISGTFEIEESGSLLAYVGWLVPFNSPLALVSSDQAQADRVTVDLFRIGYEEVRGFLPFDAWRQAGHETSSFRLASSEEAAEVLRRGAMPVLDVRFRYEIDSDPLEGAMQRPIDELSRWAEDLPKGPALLVCASGQRATMGASFLRARGIEAIALGDGGADTIRAALRAAEHTH